MHPPYRRHRRPSSCFLPTEVRRTEEKRLYPCQFLSGVHLSACYRDGIARGVSGTMQIALPSVSQRSVLLLYPSIRFAAIVSASSILFNCPVSNDPLLFVNYITYLSLIEFLRCCQTLPARPPFSICSVFNQFNATISLNRNLVYAERTGGHTFESPTY